MIYALIASNLAMIGMFVFRYPSLPPQIPLFYSKPWGEDQLVENWFILILPLLLTTFYFLNSFIYKKFFLDNLFVQKIFYYLNIFNIITITYIFFQIIILIS